MNSLEEAEAALERGDYSQCLALLEPLSQKYSLSGEEGPKIRMIMVTAFLGKGDDLKAISTCRMLTKCKDPDLRQRSKQLLSILEAPSLERPANWSIQLPNLELTSLEENTFNKLARYSKKPIKNDGFYTFHK